MWDGLKIPEGRIARLSNDRKEFLIRLIRNMIVKMTSLIFTVYVLMGKENIFLFSNKGARKCFKENCTHYCNEEFLFKFSAIDHLIKFSVAEFHKNNYKNCKNCTK